MTRTKDLVEAPARPKGEGGGGDRGRAAAGSLRAHTAFGGPTERGQGPWRYLGC